MRPADEVFNHLKMNILGCHSTGQTFKSRLSFRGPLIPSSSLIVATARLGYDNNDADNDEHHQ
jgi:hypothetical protein